MNRNNDRPSDEVRDLLTEAGPPPPISERDLDAIRAAAREEWRALRAGAGAPARTGYRRYLALAAGLLAAVALAWWWTGQRAPAVAEVVGTVELVRDGALIEPAGSGPSGSPAAGDEISTGALVRTDAGRIAVQLIGGQSVRFDSGTVASIASASRIELTRGAVYVDSRPGSASDIEVATPLGLVTEIGTQFEVRVGDNGEESVRIRVREGSVALAHERESYSASAGQQLTIDAQGEVFRASVPVRGPVWAWVLDVAPGIDIEGRPLLSYLEWIVRETGWEIQYADARLEKAAAEALMSGSIRGQTPEESLGALLPASGLGYEIRENVLVVTGAAGE